jgi:hypothetical protein
VAAAFLPPDFNLEYFPGNIHPEVIQHGIE